MNRSSSAPPTNLPDFTQSLWGPPSFQNSPIHSPLGQAHFSNQPSHFAQKTTKAEDESAFLDFESDTPFLAKPWGPQNPSPIGSRDSPRRWMLDNDIRSASPLRRNLNADNYQNEDDRMKHILNSVLDSEITAPVARAASTPPARMSSTPRDPLDVSNDLMYNMRNMNMVCYYMR